MSVLQCPHNCLLNRTFQSKIWKTVKNGRWEKFHFQGGEIALLQIGTSFFAVLVWEKMMSCVFLMYTMLWSYMYFPIDWNGNYPEKNSQWSIPEIKTNVLITTENIYTTGSETSKTALHSPEKKQVFLHSNNANPDKHIHSYIIMWC